MRKILRMFLVCFMTVFCGTVMGQEVTLDFTTNDLWSLPVNSANKATASASFSNGTYSITLAAADGYYFNTDGYLMLGKSGSTLTFPAFSFDVEKIVITGRAGASAQTKQNIYVGDVAVSTETTGAQTANTYEIASDYQAAGNVYVFKVTSNHNTQITKIEIYKKGGGSTVTVPTPSISGTTPFTENTEVTISIPEGGKTYYTTDGSDPTSSSTQYSSPFTLTETTTVKAISYDKDNNASSVASKTFKKETIEKAANIAALLAFEKGKKVTVTLNNAIVLYKGTNDIIIKDATGGTDFYQTGLELTKGQVLNGTITVLRDDYNGFKEAKKTDGTNLDNVTVTEGTVTPTNSTVANVATSEDCADLYKLENVEVVANGSNWDIVDGETTLRLRDQFKLNYTATAGKFNIIGVIGNYNGTKQFWPTEAPEATQEITIGEASDISEFIGIEEKGKPYKLTLENAQVVYSWTSTNGNIQAFVRDETGALCFDFRNDFKTVGTAFVTNKMVNGTIIMNNNVYNGLPQASAIAETNTEQLTFTDGSEAQPLKITAAEVSKNINDLVLLENVTIEEKDGKYYVGDVQLYNGMYVESFDIDKRENFSSFVGEGKNVKGIAVVYQPKTGDPVYEIYPIEITSGTDGIQNVVKPVVENGIRYNLAGQRVDENYKGVVIMNGKKYVVK